VSATDRRVRFADLCVRAEGGNAGLPEQAIGTLGEKRLHRVCKYFFDENSDHHECRVAGHIADIAEGDTVTEIQTGSLYPLKQKLHTYLKETPLSVTVVCPLIAERRIVRVEPETGEVLRCRRSGVHPSYADLLPELYWLSELLPHDRLRIHVLCVRADEYRYSERKQRYEKGPRYKAELFPRELLGETVLSTVSDFARIADIGKSEFLSSEFAAYHRLRGRRLQRALLFLCRIGVLERSHIDKKRYMYRVCDSM